MYACGRETDSAIITAWIKNEEKTLRSLYTTDRRRCHQLAMQAAKKTTAISTLSEPKMLWKSLKFKRRKPFTKFATLLGGPFLRCYQVVINLFGAIMSSTRPRAFHPYRMNIQTCPMSRRNLVLSPSMFMTPCFVLLDLRTISTLQRASDRILF